MPLIDELKQQRAEYDERLARAVLDVGYFTGRVSDLDRAIAALEPSYHPGALKEGEIASGLCSYEEAQAILSPAVDGGSSSESVEVVSFETFEPEPAAYAFVKEPQHSDYFPTQPISIAASQQHAEESAALAPLFPPEPPPPATPEQMMACGYVNEEASWWSRKMAKEQA